MHACIWPPFKMSRLSSVLSVVLMVAVLCSGQTLQCFRCDLGFWDVCYTTEVTCGYGLSCFVGIGKAASVLDIKMKGCLPEEDCNKTTTVEFPTNKTIYTMTKQCCNENYCNGSPSVIASFTVIALTVAHMTAF